MDGWIVGGLTGRRTNGRTDGLMEKGKKGRRNGKMDECVACLVGKNNLI